MRVSESQLNACEQSPAIFKPNVLRWAHLSANGLGVKDSGKTKVQYVECKLKHQEKNKKQDVTSSTVKNGLSYKVCIHHKVPLRFISSAVFLDKTLCVSLVELVDGMRNVKPALHRSVLTCRLGVPSGCKSTTDKRLLAKTNEGYERSKVDMLGSKTCKMREVGLDYRRSPLSKHQSNKMNHLAPEWGFSSEADESGMQQSSTAFGLLSFRGPTTSNTRTGKQKGNGGEAALSAQTNCRHGQHTFRFGPANSATWSIQAGRKETEEEQEDGKSSEHQRVSTCHRCCRLKDDSVGSSPNTLSLKEALELFRPDFISRSQGRVKKLEQRARRRKALQDSNLGLLQGLKEDQRKQKRNCTTPDPLSVSIPGPDWKKKLLNPNKEKSTNNLFKPRERSISGREMQLRSRRIYNKLPEVTKKKEEEKKRAVSQSNRLRAEVFKKRLLDQILQR